MSSQHTFTAYSGDEVILTLIDDFGPSASSEDIINDSLMFMSRHGAYRNASRFTLVHGGVIIMENIRPGLLRLMSKKDPPGAFRSPAKVDLIDGACPPAEE